MNQYSLFIFLAPFALLISCGTAVYCWRHIRVHCARTLSWVLIAASFYLIVNSLELLVINAAVKVFFAKVEYLAISIIVLYWFAFALEYAGKEKWLEGKVFHWFWVIPCITVLLVFSNEIHHLIWVKYQIVEMGGFLSMRVITYGFWFPVFIAYCYFIILTGVALVIWQSIPGKKVYKSQSLWIVTGALLPAIGNVVYVFHIIPGLYKDYSALTYALGGLFYTLGIFRFRLFSLTPIARATLIDHMSDGMIVIDLEQQVVDFNPAVRQILSMPDDLIIGGYCKLLSPFIDELNNLIDQPEFRTEINLPVGQKTCSFDLTVRRLYDHYQNNIGYLVTLHDISELKKLLQATRKMAIMDSLTDLFNRRQFFHLAIEETERTRNSQDSFSLMMMDIDNLKTINDTFGHKTGDLVLKFFANFLRQSLRGTDIIGRIGGDEFIVLLTATEKTSALRLAERLNGQLAQQRIETSEGNISLTVSMGITDYKGEEGVTLDHLIEQADQALYQAKNLGRNQICLSK
jgi:diguanylate cyclase (GGDEF)-like protein/PAS domain S-box-containing protein